MNQENLRNKYNEKIAQYELKLTGFKGKQFFISLLRLLVFIAGIILTVLVFRQSIISGILTLLVAVVIFLYLVRKFGEYSEMIRLTGNLCKINSNELAALDGNYSAFDGGTDMVDNQHNFSGDLDLFGEDSLFRFLNRTVTGPGRSVLATWLSRPYDLCDLIYQRQEAVRELAGKLDWRQQFAAQGLDRILSVEEIDGLNRWLHETDYPYSSLPVVLTAFLLPSVVIALLIMVIAGLLPVILFVMMFIINLFVVGLFIRKSNRIHALVTQKHIFLTSVEKLVRLFEKEEFSSSILTSIKRKMLIQKGSVADRIKSLDRIISFFDSRLNMLMGLILNGVLLWDIQCIRHLESWRKEAATDLPGWLDLLGEVDAFNSLANYSFNNPDHCFPEIAGGKPVFEAFSLGHPLLEKGTRVKNDFAIDHEGLIVIITGANMAGKSTFLRTVAVNMVLAMTGAPVCADKMKISPMDIFTSMRTTDSLSHNESYFYAELKRLKTLKERLENGERIFFILDEILKGTNSTDKSIGSKMFLRRLVELGATGLVATHDISLGEMENEFPESVINRCFEIEIDGEEISFDYILRDGITRKMNAAVLMKQMGIA
jgi:DNA mismatch repair ATPase MutS